jgi:hypothetical protein
MIAAELWEENRQLQDLVARFVDYELMPLQREQLLSLITASSGQLPPSEPITTSTGGPTP